MLLELKQLHTEADYTSQFNMFRVILQHINEFPQSSLGPPKC